MNKADKELERAEFKICNERAYRSKNNDLEYLYNYIAKHVLSWWD